MPFATDRLTRVGGREHNEDACGDLLVGNTGCWVVADGLGGHRGGETASSLAVKAVLISFESNPEFSSDALRRHLEAAQKAVLKEQGEQPALAGMRTTIVVLIAGADHALWAHVGDSRLYRVDAGRITFCTRDHSVVQAMVSAGELSARDIRYHEDRNRLLRALGNPNGELRPEFTPQDRALYKGTAFLLCTDGFWENVTEREMEVDFAKAANPREWLDRMETRLMERITQDSDNYSAVAVFFDSDSAPLPPNPKLMEDRAMNSASGPSLGTTVLLAGIMLIALAAAALGMLDWFRIQDLKLAIQGQTATQQQQAPAAELTQQVGELEKRLDAACRSGAALKPLCADNAQAATPGSVPAAESAGVQSASTNSDSKKTKKKQP